MAAKVLVLDFETHDPYIEQGLGSGWPFYHEGELEVLCFSYLTSSDLTPRVSEDLIHLKELVENNDVIVCHNANYDVGLLHAFGINYQNKVIIDTLLLAKLHNNTLLDYSLGALGTKYLGETKTSEELGQLAVSLGLIKSKAQRPETVAMRNIKKLYKADPELIQKYAKQDVSLTQKLFSFLRRELGEIDYRFYSDLIKAFIKARSKGVRVDLNRAKEVKAIFDSQLADLAEELEAIAPGVNVNSSKQLAEFFTEAGEEFPSTDKGNPSITKEWLESCGHPLAEVIVKYKKIEKGVRDFVDPLLESNRDRVYPELKIFGAAATGRTSCANPNLQQIPKRDKEIGPLVRSMYLPEEGEQWASLDFSSQESRIQIHFASLLGAPKVADLVEAYKINPAYDLHKKVAALMYEIPEEKVTKDQRNNAKTINLGLAYGMGTDKLAKSMGLSYPQGTALLNKYHRQVPFMKFLTKMCEKVVSSRGSIRTLGNRKLLYDGHAYKAMNKLVQGSAADQTYMCLVELYRQGIDFLFPIHDSIELSVKNTSVISKVKQIMETHVPMQVPSLTEAEVGPSWGNLNVIS